MTPDLLEKLATLWPEITLISGAVVCMLIGLSSSAAVRKQSATVAGAALVLAGVITLAGAFSTDVIPGSGSGAFTLDMAGYVKLAVCSVGLLLLLVAAAVPEGLRLTRESEAAGATSGGAFDPAHTIRGEFFAFFLFSLSGVMLTAGADDLAWLFLALELTSLPTYVMVATSRDRVLAQEAGVKYFFLGALAVAVFLYGFALLYGATGATQFGQMRAYVTAELAAGHALSPLLIAGLVLSIVGIAFKIAAAPMHFYAADVYQGAATPVTAFLAFVPKTAGFVAIILLLGVIEPALRAESVGISVGAEPVTWLLWVMAALTMTVGNVLALLQTSVKRLLAYSSIAHSGYMLVALVGERIAPGSGEAGALGNGAAAVLFYLVAYGVGNLGAFAVLALLEARGEEADSFDDIAGQSRRFPGLALVMLVSVLSLVGLPPMVGFVGKLYLFGTAIDNGFVGLVIIAVLNSAISAVYYLRIASACYFGSPTDVLQPVRAPARALGAGAAALATVVLGIAGGWLVDAARQATGASAPSRPIQVQKPSHDADGSPVVSSADHGR